MLGIGNTPIEKKFKDTRETIQSGTLDQGRAALHDQLRYKESWNSPEEVKKLAIQIAEKYPNGVGGVKAEDIRQTDRDAFTTWLRSNDANGLLGHEYASRRTEWNQNNIEAEDAATASTPAVVSPEVSAATRAIKGASDQLQNDAAALSAVLNALGSDSIEEDVNVNTLFSNPSEAGLRGHGGAIAQFIGIQNDDRLHGTNYANTLLGPVTGANGKVNSAAFVTAVRNYRAPAPAPGATTATPAPGGPAPAAPTPGTPAAPGAPATP